MSIEEHFDVGFVAKLTAEEKQIQQNYRPVIGVHKWFARRPGALFRGLLLAEFGEGAPLREAYFCGHELRGLRIADPFMGGGTTLFEANRVGCNVVGFDINPMAFWVVRQELCSIDRAGFRRAAEQVVSEVEKGVGELYKTRCLDCGRLADAKYFMWVKQQRCGGCGNDLDLFPGYLVADNSRHTHFVLNCPGCQGLAQVEQLPKSGVVACPACGLRFDWRRGPAAKNRYECECGHVGKYPAELREDGPPRHRLFAIEYHCDRCRETHKGRFFKAADKEDLRRFRSALRQKKRLRGLPCPKDEIPDGDETKRLHRWGYHFYREMFNERQLVSLGLLVRAIRRVKEPDCRHALATVFSDFLRYQNMLCRYDTYALKCQDIFAVHGFPVGLVQCENNVLGIERIGAGGFRHFVEKYDRAKAYCEAPFETRRRGKASKSVVPVAGERIAAELVGAAGELRKPRQAFIAAASMDEHPLESGTLDGVFTDPPYFDNVQYAELMDFCFAWLRLLLGGEFHEFQRTSTRSGCEFTGNKTLGRTLDHFTAGLSRVFSASARALKPGAPFVFTYHHNDITAYVPVVAAVLDAGLFCTATLPSPAEMTASLHINGTGSSVVDTVIVCRRQNGFVPRVVLDREALKNALMTDRLGLLEGGVQCTRGDLYCLALGRLSRAVIDWCLGKWDRTVSVRAKIERVERELREVFANCETEAVIGEVLSAPATERRLRLPGEVNQASLFDQVGHGAH